MYRPRAFLPFLLALSIPAAGCRPGDSDQGRDLRQTDETSPLFTQLPSSRTGVRFANLVPETAARNGLSYQYYYNGGGVAVGDVNNDGLPDLYFTANMGPNHLYLNRGDMSFEDVTEEAGVAGPLSGWATGVTFVDINADGRLDIYVSQSGPFGDENLRRNLLFVNRTEGRGIPAFTEEASAYGLDDPAYSTQAAFFDCDGDGDLDMYLMNVGIPAYRTLLELQTEKSPYETDKLYRNDGGRFVDVSSEAGLIDTNVGFGLGLSVGDLNNDGLPDIYVANDYSGRDYLYLGRGDGRFDEVLEESLPHIPLSSMGSDLADIDGDGWLDLAVLEMDLPDHFSRVSDDLGFERERFALLFQKGLYLQYMDNALQWNRGSPDGRNPTFSEVAQLAGIGRTDWSWSPLFADLDNDGKPDLFVSNGMAGVSIDADFDQYMERRIAEVQAAEGRVTEALILELIRNMPRRKAPNRAFHNEGELAFTDRADEWGLAKPSYSNGVAYSDLDRDGDLDLVVNNLLEEAFVFQNNLRERGGGHFLAIQLRGPPRNPFGVGARVRLKAGGAQQVQELQPTRGYQSSVEPRLHFGLGASTVVDTLEIRWPDGSREVRSGVASDQFLTLDYADATRDGSGSFVPAPPALFQSATEAIRPLPTHHSSVSFLDPSLEPYPTKRDEVVLAVGDLTGDGLDDFVFGGSGSEPTRVYVQERNGAFRQALELAQSGAERRSVGAAVFDSDGDGRKDIWLAVEYASRSDRSVFQHRLYLNGGDGSFGGPEEILEEEGGDGVTLSAADFDGDGHLDMFVGHRWVPGTGTGHGSRLLRGEGRAFRDVTAEVAPALSDLRTVTDATWTDLDGNGTPDLLVAGEWMPIRIFLNDGRRLREPAVSTGLDTLTGWWQSLAVADFDGDGDSDLVAGNLGLNYPYHPTPAEPFELFLGDFNGDGRVNAVSGYHEGGKLYPWFGRERLSAVLPWVPELYPTNHAFAQATLPEIMGPEVIREAEHLEVSSLATVYLENLGAGQLRAHPLPRAAQLSVAAGSVPADFDGDGILDLVLAGNLYTLDPSVPRLDGGVGLFLKGDGSGGFHPVPPMESGLWLRGSVRRLRMVRMGAEGKPGILAGVAGGQPMLYVAGGG